MRVAEEDGFTLIEFLVVMSMMLVLIAAIGPVLVSAGNQQSDQSTRISAIDGGRNTMDRVTRELRQACSISPTTGSTGVLTSTQLVGTTAGYLSTCADYSPAGSLHTIRYDCTVVSVTPGPRKCVRTDVTAGTSVLMIDGVTNTNPFTVSGASGGHPRTAIALQLQPSAKHTSIRLEDSATSTLAVLP
jgi:prepilin-type N-terminal cleavage/methylation domain-containing protein